MTERWSCRKIAQKSVFFRKKIKITLNKYIFFRYFPSSYAKIFGENLFQPREWVKSRRRRRRKRKKKEEENEGKEKKRKRIKKEVENEEKLKNSERSMMRPRADGSTVERTNRSKVGRTD